VRRGENLEQGMSAQQIRSILTPVLPVPEAGWRLEVDGGILRAVWKQARHGAIRLKVPAVYRYSTQK
jgi:hypothetical protein